MEALERQADRIRAAKAQGAAGAARGAAVAAAEANPEEINLDMDIGVYDRVGCGMERKGGGIDMEIGVVSV